MKKLLLFCFLMNSGLMAMDSNTISEISQVATPIVEKIKVNFGTHFEKTDIANGVRSCRLLPTAVKELNIKNLDPEDCLNFVNEVGQETFQAGFNTGKAELNAFYQSFYDSKPKKIGLGILALIIVGSVAYTGKKLFCYSQEKFKQWRNGDTE